MKQILTTFTVLFSHFLCFAQNVSYRQSHKEVEYTYGVIADNDFEKISQIEKIKYELRYTERSIVKTIDENFQTEMDITIDSNGHEQPWMNLAKRFRYTNSEIQLFDKKGNQINSIKYTDEQLRDKIEIRDNIRTYGFHPGLVSFPEFTAEMRSTLLSEGIKVTTDNEGNTIIENGTNEKETYNAHYLTITREWIDKDGYKNKETEGYMPYGEKKGYLLRLSKTEKFIHSVNGPCITEVTLKYYSDYKIQDNANLINKTIGNIETIVIYPNPNNGIFSVAVTLPNQSEILSSSIVNLINGNQYSVNAENSNYFVVSLPDIPSGNYVLKVKTNQSTLSTQFFKQ